MNNTEMHSELIAAGWRLVLDGRWRSPNAEDSRFSIKTLAARRGQSTPHGKTNKRPISGG